MKKEELQAKKYPPIKIQYFFNDIRSGYKPTGNRMLFILVSETLYIGGYSDGQFWDGSEENDIPTEEVTAWAYMRVPDFIS